MKVGMVCTTALLISWMGAAIAQERPTQRDEKSNASSTQADAEIAAVQLAEHRNEVELAKFAQQKSQNEQVRQFAAKMIKDHGEAVTKLEKIAGRLAGDQRDSADPSRGKDAPQRGVLPTDDPPSKANVQVQAGREGVQVEVGGKAGHAALNWVTIHQQMAARCLASAKRELASKEGAEFDRCYIGMQVFAHQKMIDSDQVFANYVSGEHRETVEECMKTAQEHLREAKSIMETLAGKAENVKTTTARD